MIIVVFLVLVVVMCVVVFYYEDDGDCAQCSMLNVQKLDGYGEHEIVAGLWQM